MAKNLQLLNADRPGLRPVYDPSGPPQGYTGIVAPGYAAPGDPRLLASIDDFNTAIVYSAASWEYASNAVYGQGTIHYTTVLGATATLPQYYGGGFKIEAYTVAAWGQMDVYDNGQKVHTVNYSTVNEQYAHVLTDANGDDILYDLPAGLHNLVFVYVSGGYGVQDVVSFIPKV